MKRHGHPPEVLLLVVLVLSLFSQPWSRAQEVPNAPVWKAPARAARATNPVRPDARSLAEGKQIYANECLVCHGASGKGDGSKAGELRTNPGDLSDPRMSQQTDGELFWKITRGRTPMPAYRGRFSEKQRWAMVNYLRTLVDRAGAATASTEPPKTAELQPPDKPRVAAARKPGDESAYVSREEHQKLKNDYDQLKKEIDAIKAHIPGLPKAAAPGRAATQSDAQEAVDEKDQELEELNERVQQNSPGTTKFLLSGFASGGFTSKRGTDSLFSANFAPLFLWKLSDRLLFESELDVTLEDDETDFDLVRAQIYYLINDYVTLGVGKFLSPMNFLEDRLHQVTKLPDKPLAIQALLPESNVGLQARGGIPIGATKLGYAFYVANAPTVETEDPTNLGALQFDNFDNLGGHVAVGGRVGFYPIPELEVGYGFQISGLGAVGQDAEALLHSVDLNYVRDVKSLKGTLNFLVQWVWSEVEALTFDPDGSLGFGPVAFSNDRKGGYAQLAYRPTMVQSPVLNRLEAVLRYERFDQEETAAGFNEQRWNIGLNYWLMPSAVIKVAYQFDDRTDNLDQDAFLIQFKIGF